MMNETEVAKTYSIDLPGQEKGRAPPSHHPMIRLTLVAACFGLVVLRIAAEVPPTAFFSGNDVHHWCQRDKPMAQSYVAGLYDMAAHGATAIDNMRHWHKDMPNNDAEVDFALDRVVGYCKSTAPPSSRLRTCSANISRTTRPNATGCRRSCSRRR